MRGNFPRTLHRHNLSHLVCTQTVAYLLDINGTWNPLALGYTGGVVVTANKVQPYGGMVFGTPMRAASIMVNTHDDITPGLGYSISGGFIILKTAVEKSLRSIGG